MEGNLLFFFSLYCTCINFIFSLDKYIKFKERKIPEEIVWRIFREISLGLSDIHEADILHLDLKPMNILIDDKGFIKIGDFGISVRKPVVSFFFFWAAK